MYRNLDMTALRSFVAVAETGGVTRAAGKLHLTQSTVSMQIRRLETALSHRLVERAGRGITLTTHGEQLLSYSRDLLAINDAVIKHMTHEQFSGEIVLGVPPDIVHPHVTKILQAFNAAFPNIMVKLISTRTVELLDMFQGGQLDLTLTTEAVPQGGETMISLPLKYYGVAGGTIWKVRPLRLAFERRCMFRPLVIDALDAHGIKWDMTITTLSCHDSVPYINADLAVTASLQGTENERWAELPAAAGLPALPHCRICLYVTDGLNAVLAQHLAAIVRDVYLA